MAKIVSSHEGSMWLFHCPGCQYGHVYYVKPPNNDPDWIRCGKPLWTWNGSIDKPTFRASLLNTHVNTRCHLFVTDGMIEFLGDCTHSLANRTVPMGDV